MKLLCLVNLITFWVSLFLFSLSMLHLVDSEGLIQELSLLKLRNLLVLQRFKIHKYLLLLSEMQSNLNITQGKKLFIHSYMNLNHLLNKLDCLSKLF